MVKLVVYETRITTYPGRLSMGISTPRLSTFEDQTPSGRPIGKCHSDHSISRFDGLSILSSNSPLTNGSMFRFWELETSILSKPQLEPIGSQNRVVGVTFSDGSTARRTHPTAFSVHLGSPMSLGANGSIRAR